MKKNIVLLHGWGAETKKLSPLKKELENIGWKVFLPELPGFGISAPKNIWGVKEYAFYINKVSKEFFAKEKYICFGHSFGGGIAIKMAVGGFGEVSAIVLCATRGISRGKGVKRFVFKTAAKAGKVFLLTPGMGSKFKKVLYKAAREHDYEKLDGVMRDIFKKVISEGLKPDIKNIKKPVLVIWGEKDKMTPLSDAQYLKNNIKNVKVKLFPDQGHRLPYEKPKELSDEIEKWYQHLK